MLLTMSGQVQIVWFKRDLRVVDNPALCAAAAAGPVLPVYIVEPDYWHLPDTSGRQYTFLLETLAELGLALAGAGSHLHCETGAAERILPALANTHGAMTIWSQEETGNDWTFQRDRRVAAALRHAGVTWHELPQPGVHRRLETRNGWARRWDQAMQKPRLATPALQAPPRQALARDTHDITPPSPARLGLKPDRCPERQHGGREAGLQALQTFLDERGQPYRSAMSAPREGAQHCSRISPYLALGAISMREVAQAGWRRQANLPEGATRRQWSGSMRSFISRLHWRDHFMQKLESEPEIEWRDMHPGLRGLRPDDADPETLEAWATGETGIPFIDACMRSLIATGWMNFRMRAMLVSFASYHLWQPWQASGLVLARYFTDYEPGIHWSQVQMQSGTTGVNAIRIYNPIKQGRDQDPAGQFIRDWIPELADLPDDFIHEPWRWPDRSDLAGYPAPIIDVERAGRAARERIFAARRGEGFKTASQAVLARHGSRARRKTSNRSDPSKQLTLEL